MKNLPLISPEKLASHCSASSCWIALHGIVYNVTSFLDKHPGGQGIILKYAGTDATKSFSAVHPPDFVQMLDDAAAIGTFKSAVVADDTAVEVMPNISIRHVLNTYDFARNAKKRLTEEAWSYLVSGSDDEVSYRSNESSFDSVWFKPRVLVDVSDPIDTSVNLLGTACALPVFISATAMGKLFHPDGEVALCRGAFKSGIIQMCPTLASCSLDEMANARLSDSQTQWFQLYVNSDRAVTERTVRRAEALGMKALVITVDTAVLGKRERDMRHIVQSSSIVEKDLNIQSDKSKGVTKSLSPFISASLDWNEIKWIQSLTKMDIVLKGIQTGQDAVRAALLIKPSAILVSNHGGRQMDYARPSLEVLGEVVDELRKYRINIPVFIDGGIRRGTDILKCLALGAKAVGIGRAALFALASHGEEGIVHLTRILSDELITAMKLTGCRSIADIDNSILDCSRMKTVVHVQYLLYSYFIFTE